MVTARGIMGGPPPNTAPPPAPKPGRKTRHASGTGLAPGLTKSHAVMNNQPPPPTFYALIKNNNNSLFGAEDTASEVYARPPSDHFYFKINDGKTEFI